MPSRRSTSTSANTATAHSKISGPKRSRSWRPPCVAPDSCPKGAPRSWNFYARRPTARSQLNPSKCASVRPSSRCRHTERGSRRLDSRLFDEQRGSRIGLTRLPDAIGEREHLDTGSLRQRGAGIVGRLTGDDRNLPNVEVVRPREHPADDLARETRRVEPSFARDREG